LGPSNKFRQKIGGDKKLAYLSRIWLGIRLKFQVRGNVSPQSGFYVGPRTRVWAPNSLQIGRNCKMGSDCVVEVDGKIGNDVLISSKVGIVGRTDHGFREIGTPVHLSTWVGVSEGSKLSQPVEIGNDVWIGYGATILSGVTIGSFAVVAAGAVVVHNVDENQIVAGNPATPIGTRFSREQLIEHKTKMGRE
jgi:acetyltransferase-like isoleucine patch superfamily enzyme